MPMNFKTEEEYQAWLASHPQAQGRQDPAGGEQTGGTRPSGRPAADKSNEKPDTRNNYERLRDTARSAPSNIRQKIHDTTESLKASAASARKDPGIFNKNAAGKAGAALDRGVRKTAEVARTAQRGVNRVRENVQTERKGFTTPFAGFGFPGGVLGSTGSGRGRSPSRRSPARAQPLRYTKWSPGFFPQSGGRNAVVDFSAHPMAGIFSPGGSLFGRGFDLGFSPALDISRSKTSKSGKKNAPVSVFGRGFQLHFSSMLDTNRGKR
jgi:hypothetical protein